MGVGHHVRGEAVTGQLPLWASLGYGRDSVPAGDVVAAPASRTTVPAPIVCAGCGGEIVRPKSNKRFCTDDCRFKAWDREHPRKGSPKAEAARRRDEGLARVEEHGGDWMEEAGEVLEKLVAEMSGEVCPWEGFKAILLGEGLRKPHHPNAWGMLVRRAVKAGWLKRVGYCIASSPESHGTEMRIYRVKEKR